MDWNKMVKMTVPVGLCGWQQRGSLTINGRTTEFPVGVETELPEPVAERIKALMADAAEKAEHVQPLKPWMQHVTGADGVARWEPRLAYEENKVVEIIPPTEVGRIWYGYVEVDCPNSGEVKVGDAGVMYINGEPHKYTATEQINLSGPPVIVQLDVEGVDTSLGKIGLNSSKKLVFHNIPIGSADTNNTISLTKESYTLKPLAPKYLPSGSGGGGVIYIGEDGAEAEVIEATAYADEGLTIPLTYDQGVSIVKKPFAIILPYGEAYATIMPMVTVPEDSEMKIACNMPNAGIIVLDFSDTP